MRTPAELEHRLLNEYKEGKAYRYYVSGWVREVLYHPVSKASPWCYLYARVCPSMRTRIKDYQVWALVKKDDGTKPGGQIFSAYCTCTAGLLGTCNHVAGLLFRVEAAVRCGLTDPACTAQTCKWNLPSQRSDVLSEPAKACSISWNKGHYMNQDRLQQGPSKRALFSPLSDRQEATVKDEASLRTKLADLLRDVQPDSCFQQLMDMKRFPAPKAASNDILPDSLKEVAQGLGHLSLLEATEELCSFKFTKEECAAIHRETISQSHSPTWHVYRAGMITASKMKAVVTRMVSISKDPSEDTTSLVRDIMGYKPLVKTAAMKYGLAQEPHAKKILAKLLRKTHKCFSFEECGLTVSHEHPCIGATPDLLVSCSCHGKGVCEIKCPPTIKSDIPRHDNVEYLELKDNQVRLKRNHKHYYQIQGQMAVTDRTYGYFFVYTSHGNHLERIEYDAELWSQTKATLCSFWKSYVVPELLTQTLWDKQDLEMVQGPRTAQHEDHPYYKSGSSDCPAKSSYLPKPTSNFPVYLCGKCCEDAVSNVIECCTCKVWFHFTCVNITGNIPDVWHCDNCTAM